MKLKQRVAYGLALLMGALTAFSGVNVPLFSGELSVIQVNAETAPAGQSNSGTASKGNTAKINATFDKKGLVCNTVSDRYDEKVYFYVSGLHVNGQYPIVKDTNSSELYFFDKMNQKWDSSREKLEYVELTFYKEADKNIQKKVKITGFDKIKSGDKNASLTLTSDDFDFGTSSTISVPIIASTFSTKVISIEDGKSYSTSVGYKENDYYQTQGTFKPSTSGKYIFSGSGGKDIVVDIWEVDDDDDDDGKIVAKIKPGETSKTASISMTAGRIYEINIYMAWTSDKQMQSLTFSITKATDTSTTTQKSTDTKLPTTTYVTTSTKKSKSKSSSSSSSFDKGDFWSTGSGAAKADYIKTGDDTVRFDASEISDSAKTARVPATVKIKGKTYKVTSIAAKAFSGKDNLSSLTIGANVKKLGDSFVSNCPKLKVITVNTTQLTKSGVKNSLKGSSVNTVKAPGTKVNHYSKIFTKSNTNSKGKVKVRAK